MSDKSYLFLTRPMNSGAVVVFVQRYPQGVRGINTWRDTKSLLT